MNKHGPGRGRCYARVESRANLGKRQEPKAEKVDRKQIKGDFRVSMLKRFSVSL